MADQYGRIVAQDWNNVSSLFNTLSSMESRQKRDALLQKQEARQAAQDTRDTAKRIKEARIHGVTELYLKAMKEGNLIDQNGAVHPETLEQVFKTNPDKKAMQTQLSAEGFSRNEPPEIAPYTEEEKFAAGTRLWANLAAQEQNKAVVGKLAVAKTHEGFVNSVGTAKTGIQLINSGKQQEGLKLVADAININANGMQAKPNKDSLTVGHFEKGEWVVDREIPADQIETEVDTLVKINYPAQAAARFTAAVKAGPHEFRMKNHKGEEVNVYEKTGGLLGEDYSVFDAKTGKTIGHYNGFEFEKWKKKNGWMNEDLKREKAKEDIKSAKELTKKRGKEIKKIDAEIKYIEKYKGKTSGGKKASGLEKAKFRLSVNKIADAAINDALEERGELSAEEKKTIRKTATLNALGLPEDSRAANTKDGETLYYSKKTNFFYDEFGNVVATGKKEK